MRKLALGLALALVAVLTPLQAQSRSTWPSTALLTDATATTTGDYTRPAGVNTTFQAYGATTAGAGAATIVIEVSNLEAPVNSTNVDWITAATITLTLSTTRTSDGFAMQAPWRN